MNDFNAAIIEEFRANEGKVGGPFEAVPMVLLHTTGAKTGQDRIAPLASRTYHGRLIVFASKAGAPTHPDWFHNLLADPSVTVEAGTETYAATASVVEGEDRDRIYAEQVAAVPVFAEYQERAGDRQIPVVELTRT